MLVEAEIVAARLTLIRSALDAIEPVCLESEATRDTFLELKQEIAAAHDTFLKLKQQFEAADDTFLKLTQELEAAHISVRPVRPIRP
jgi:hypothetical protein